MSRRKILFVAENVTLAQVVRLCVLARSLDPEAYEVHFACSEFSELIFAGADFQKWPLDSVDAVTVFARLESGKTLYDARTLERYVESDLRVLRAVEPDLVVGDLRWSLAVSAPKYGVLHAALANAYFSPYAVERSFPVPDHPIVRLLGLRTAERYFPLAMPVVFRKFAAPLNQLRKKHGFSEIGSLLEVLTYGDYTLYADSKELVPTQALPATHRYLGPVLWSPGGALPESWGDDRLRAPVYVTLGSSGAVGTLPAVVEGLSGLALDVLVASAGRELPERTRRASVRVEEFVPGDSACRKARFVVTNGGSSTGYQALSEGKPVLGIAHNLDQYLAMTSIERAGAGILLRADGLRSSDVRAAAERLLSERAYAESATKVAKDFARYDAQAGFRAFVESVFSSDEKVPGPETDAREPVS